MTTVRILLETGISVKHKNEYAKTAPILSPVLTDKQKLEESSVALFVRERLRHYRENVRRMSPEELAAQVGEGASPSYIRRIEKGENGPTVEMLDRLLRALGVNIGAFFEPLIEESGDVDAMDRRYQRILQRGLDSKDKETRDAARGLCKLIERTLKEKPG